tara:strand:- start:452 stop:616 length:165 start_codon:yes stop_codon:yes gene_type:complete
MAGFAVGTEVEVAPARIFNVLLAYLFGSGLFGMSAVVCVVGGVFHVCSFGAVGT